MSLTREEGASGFWFVAMDAFSGSLPRTSRAKERRMASVPVVRFPIVFFVRVLGVFVAALLLTWTNHFRGGLALISDNKDLIFNVPLSLSLSPLNFSFWVLLNSAPCGSWVSYYFPCSCFLWFLCCGFLVHRALDWVHVWFLWFAERVLVFFNHATNLRLLVDFFFPIFWRNGVNLFSSIFLSLLSVLQVHPVLMVIGLVLLNGEGICFSPIVCGFSYSWEFLVWTW